MSVHSTGLAVGHRLGRYEILAKIASGGMAVVYIASVQGAAGFERLFAIKVLHANLAHEEEFIRMFLDEARLAALLRHPNVVATTDISDSLQTGYFLVMEYVEGDHLGALLGGAHNEGTRLDLPVVMRIAVDALAGLGAAHALCDEAGKPLNLVHRDVSPHNILVGLDGVSRLTDFGVAKAEDRLTHTRDGQVKGKLAYMAPEQASSGTSDARSDLFSMGIILWECVTGRRLFRAETTGATLQKLLTEEIPPVSAVDPVLAPLDFTLRKALEREPARRFQSADAFIEAIETISPAVGGIASRRAVTKAVSRFAAEKLARDRRLLEAAQVVLRGGGTPSSDGDSEASLSAVVEASLASSSMSRSRPGTALTAPRLFTKARSLRPSGAVTVPSTPPLAAVVARGSVQEPPPPLGPVSNSLVPAAPATLQYPEPGATGRTWFVMAALLLVLACGIAYFVNTQPIANVTPRSIPLAPATRPKPPPPLEEARRPSLPVPREPQPASPAAVPAPQASASAGPSAARPVQAAQRAQARSASVAAPQSGSSESRRVAKPRKRTITEATPAAPAPAPPEAPPASLLPNPYKH